MYSVTAMTSVVPSKKYSKFTSKKDGRSKNTADLWKLDESRYKSLWGNGVFPDTENLTDLYINPYQYPFDLYFAPVSDPSNRRELLDYNGLNFGVNWDRYLPLAIEVITDPSNGYEYLGTHLLLAHDGNSTGSDDPYFHPYTAFVGFLFDQDGRYMRYLGPPVDNKGMNDVEKIFGFDINGDGKKGGLPINQSNNLIQIDELQELRDLGYQTFNSSRNLANLWLDTVNGNIYTNDVYFPEDQILLNYNGNSEFTDYEDYNPIPVQDRNIKPLAIEYLLEGDKVPSWAVGGYLLIGADQNNDNSIIGIVYDENGNYIIDIGSPKGNFAINQTENLARK